LTDLNKKNYAKTILKSRRIPMEIIPLFDDEYKGAPAKRVLAHLIDHKEKGDHVVGTYCSYAPLEIMKAMDIVPAVLCAFSNGTVAAAEEVLPANLCPLIKSSYGFIQSDTCPFFSLSEAVIGETTCDGKKKMFELISDKKPLYVMDLPQVPQYNEALVHWTAVIKKMKLFLENTFSKKADDKLIEEAICDTNEKNRLVLEIFGFAAQNPPVISWNEMLDIVFLATPLSGKEVNHILKDKISMLKNRVDNGTFIGKNNAPRILVTGSPLGGDAAKIYKIIESEGGVVVAIDSCMGLKTFTGEIKEKTDDPIGAIAERYLGIPCSCMTPNNKRLDEITKLIEKFKPDAVIDVILQACHSYNIESIKVEKHVREKHSLPFLKIVTDYTSEDSGQLTTRIGALIEMIKK
jgi:benzoyl-CoA reductase/2-hydroxyglutaryl-CoA dehydratase subunit BcrC/BadD/HgdB